MLNEGVAASDGELADSSSAIVAFIIDQVFTLFMVSFISVYIDIKLKFYRSITMAWAL